MLNIDRRVAIRLAAVAFSFLAARADGEEQSSAMTVRASVSTSCRITTIEALDFGSISSTGGTIAEPVDAPASVRLECNAGTQWSVYADAGNHADGDQRRMANGSGASSPIPYDLYADKGRQDPFPTNAETASATATTSGEGTDAEQIVPIYGRVAEGQAEPAAGDYSDQVAITLSF